jgi:hypothetical protein
MNLTPYYRPKKKTNKIHMGKSENLQSMSSKLGLLGELSSPCDGELERDKLSSDICGEYARDPMVDRSTWCSKSENIIKTWISNKHHYHIFNF